MLFHYFYKQLHNISETNKDKAIMLAYKMLPEYIFDTAKLENNPITFPEVKTLIDGITIGGHKIGDVEQILNIKNAWISILEDIKSNQFSVTKELFHKINKLIAHGETLYAGQFRDGNVGISGTKKYKSPNFNELNIIFDSEINLILNNFDHVSQAIRIFLWGNLNKFYWNKNKITALLIANGILINSGIGVLIIKASDILAFNTLMLDFYDTQIADDIVNFLNEKAIVTIED